MSDSQRSSSLRPTRRGVIAGAVSAGLGGAIGFGARQSLSPATTVASTGGTVPFHGAHQAGIVTAQQAHVVLAAFDVTSAKRSDLVGLLAGWTELAAALATGQPAPGRKGGAAGLRADSGIADSLPSADLTMTVGFGRSLFDGRFGLAAHRPEALVDLPAFPGDRLIPGRSDGDLLVQLCANDPQALSHAFLHLRAASVGSLALRWSEHGFISRPNDGTAPRNLLGLADGTANPAPGAETDRLVWADPARSPHWMTGGTYLVYRRIRLLLPKWSLTPVQAQDTALGRRIDGSPLSAPAGADPRTPLNLTAKHPDGSPVIPHRAHVRRMRPFAMMRRSYNYDYGFDAARGVKHSGGNGHTHGPGGGDDHSHGPGDSDHAGHDGYDAGLLFLTYNTDPRTQFIPAQRELATNDDLVEFMEPVGSGIYAVPGGLTPGQSFGHGLF